MKGLIIYTSKYGATRQYAEYLHIAMGIPMVTPENISKEDLAKYDYLIIGSPVYIGRLRIKNWLKNSAKTLNDKKIFFFLVSATDVNENRKLEQIIADNVSDNLQIKMELFYFHGRLIKRKLGLADKFLLNMGARLSQNKNAGQHMLEDFDDVKQSTIMPLAMAVEKYLNAGFAHKYQPLRDADRFLQKN